MCQDEPTAASWVGKPHSNKALRYLVKDSPERQTFSKRYLVFPFFIKKDTEEHSVLETFIECAREVG